MTGFTVYWKKKASEKELPAAREKSRLKAEEKKRKEDEKNRLIWSFLVQFVDDIKSGARKIGSVDYSAGSVRHGKATSVFMRVLIHYTSLNGLI
ncbi:MAG: hypothetical protein K2F74_07275 [Muribaculaceae bacterium]|nr:hypothetical protein [Muribaculaceae bacterium]MDE6131377.1 hypothetical protein [Muribaculaceae bacterium]